jgi:tetratricopeptide (TPR) repeat protein
LVRRVCQYGDRTFYQEPHLTPNKSIFACVRFSSHFSTRKFAMATNSEALAIAFRHHQAGRLQVAEQIYRQILAAEPNHADALHLLGVVAGQTGQYDVAVNYAAQAISLNSHVSAFHNTLGYALMRLGKLNDAVACFRTATILKPDYTEAHNNLGHALLGQRKFNDAAASFRMTTKLKPDYAEAHNDLGNALLEQGNIDDAIACFRTATILKPDYIEAHCNLGNAFIEQGKFDDAIAHCRTALALKSDNARALTILGTAFMKQSKLDDAIACYRRALELRPDAALAHHNLGIAFKDQGKQDDAVACYEKALALKPDFAEAHMSRAFNWLLTGDWQRGWPESEWRWKTKGVASRCFAQPLWDGALLSGKTILMHAEQGLGDTIQFVRYAAIAERLGGTVVVECHKPLMPLLESCPGIDHLVGQGNELPAFDVHAPLMSLPGILKTSVATVPASIPYLVAKPTLLEHWRKRLSELDGFKIGISWQGNPKHHRDRFRSIPLACFAPVAQIPGIRLISLQKGAGSEQLVAVRDRFPVTDLASELDEQSGPFMDTAAVMKNLDLVITSDTATAHLAGALGVPVWVALSFAPDWRWLLDCTDCPWYPTMRLFRQKVLGDWSAVFAGMATELPLQAPR